MSFADRLKISRKEKGYSQEALAEELEVSRQSITKWETGTAFPELRKLIQISVKLDKDLDWLLFDERNELIVNKDSVNRDIDGDKKIYDMESLKQAVRDKQICGILRSLEGSQYRERVEEEGFSGERIYVVFGCRMYVSGSGIDPKTGESVTSFWELSPLDAVETLLRYIRGEGSTET
jgi:transcriptional regulator with XRE-family HTH domain